jgi:CheY-like chemotaxis protein
MRPHGRPIDGAPEQSERLREIGKVSGELLHDMVGMLSVLVGRVSLAREALATGRVTEEDLARIQSDAEELRRMVAEVLAELQGRRPSPEVTFPVTETLEEVVDRWLEGAPAVSVALECALPAKTEVAGPRSYFVRIMVNLLRNASRHARSQVRLSVTPVRDGAWAEILVDDDGAGVSEELEGRLFEPFVRGEGPESESGTGLGLSFARWASERLGGELTLEGRARGLGGASFRVLLPLAPLRRAGTTPNQNASTEGPARDRGAPLAALSVAVVDDDPAVRRVFGRLLARAGARPCEVDPGEARTPDEIVDRLASEDPDVILLDLNLGPLTGVQVYDALAERAPDLAERVLFLTGDTAADPPRPRPLVHKLITWDELSAQVLEVDRVRRSGPDPDGPVKEPG